MTATEKTLYDKTIARRVVGSSRRTRRVVAAGTSLGVLAALGAASMAPAQAQVRLTDIGGFATMATASPLKIEIFEPVIPIPTDPQAEFDVSYTKVVGESGPSTTARASAFWPGSGLGEGAKTFGDQLGIPAALTAGGYPAQANAQYPGDNTSQSQELGPGMYGRVNADDKATTAVAAYSTSAPQDGDSGDGSAPASTNPLDLLKGDPTKAINALTGALTGGASAGTNPLGALATLVDMNGVTSVSSTKYTATSATATATSRVGEISVALGLVKLNGVNVVTRTTSSIDGGAKTTQTVDVGSIEIAGQQFKYGPNGLTAAGSTTPASATSAGAAAIAAGISFDVPKPVVTKDGLAGTGDAQALTVTIDLKTLKSALGSPSLPIEPIVGAIPDLPGQANILKGVLGSLNAVAPKLVLRMGQASSAAMVVPQFDMGSDGEASAPTGTPGTTTPGTTGAPAGGAPGTDPGASAGEIPPAASGGENPITNDEVNPLAGVPGLPPLGSVPMWLILGGLLLGAGVGWYLRNAGFVLFGGRGAGLCNFGLKAGIPDLRKV